MKLTQRRIKEVLEYDPKTGEFKWKIRGKGISRSGAVGCNNNGYHMITVDQHPYYAHRLAWLWMTGKWPRKHIDHIDMNRSNNCWNNLREATIAQNRRNSFVPIINQSGFKGVILQESGRWRSVVGFNYKKYRIGTFANKVDAAISYNYHAAYLHNDFARLNEIPPHSYIHD